MHIYKHYSYSVLIRVYSAVWSRMSSETTDSLLKNMLTKSLDVDSAGQTWLPRAMSKHEPF